MNSATEAFSRRGKTLETVQAYVQHSITEHWQDTWHRHLSELENLYQRAGDPAYGLYSRMLFGPVQQELQQAGIICEPAFPGTFPLSQEAWGSEDARERRFWCVLRQQDGKPLGALVTRYFHDHTRLRIPQAPQILALPETDPMIIAVSIEQSALPGL